MSLDVCSIRVCVRTIRVYFVALRTSHDQPETNGPFMEPRMKIGLLCHY